PHDQSKGSKQDTNPVNNCHRHIFQVRNKGICQSSISRTCCNERGHLVQPTQKYFGKQTADNEVAQQSNRCPGTRKIPNKRSIRCHFLTEFPLQSHFPYSHRCKEAAKNGNRQKSSFFRCIRESESNSSDNQPAHLTFANITSSSND